MTFAMRRLSESGTELFVGAELSGPSDRFPGGIICGRSTMTDVAALPGKPSESAGTADSATWSYLVPGDAAGNYLNFDFVRDTLRSVWWLPYAG
jgi:hypothetical protein